MRLSINLKPVSLKYFILTAIFLNTSMVYPVSADDSNTTIGDLSARIEELENRLGQRGEDSDDTNPGAKVSREDLEPLQDRIRALEDAQTRLHENLRHLEAENASLRLENTPKKSASSVADSPEGKPTEKRKRESWNQTPSPSQMDEETQSVLELLEQSAPPEDEEDASSKKKGKRNLEEVQETATKQAEETTPTLKTGNAQAEYNAAMALHDKEAYKEAEKAFSYFIKVFPNDPLVPKAMYWKAECAMKQGHNKGAQILFVTAYKKNPKGPKAPDCLLKLGETFALLGKKENACIAWKKLETDFPHMTKEMKTELTALKKQYACKPKPEKASVSTPKALPPPASKN